MIVLARVEMRLLDCVFSAGEYNGQVQAMGKSGFVINATTRP
jgi:hypothetical protein